MTSRKIIVVTGVLLCMLSAPVASQGSKDWVDIKDPKELRALYSNKTFRSTFNGEAVVEYYRADGKGLHVHAKERVPRTWEIKGGDQVCVTDTNGTFCNRFQRSKKKPNEYVRRSSPDNYMVVITVEDGVPQF